MTAAPRERALAARARLTDWLFEKALPLWSETGTDWAQGGFFETIDQSGRPSTLPRRTRVVGRQIFAFAVSGAIGWRGPSDRLVAHGLDYLKHRCLNHDGTVISVSRPDGTIVDRGFDLYDHAFALFGLAVARGAPSDHAENGAIARRMLMRIREGWSHPVAGFEESAPRTLPLKANPHMHLFEASLAWIESAAAGDRPVWSALADEIAELCLSRFIDSRTGALREFFDGAWRPIAGDEGRIVEPGHQFEWAWLLVRWGRRQRRPDALAAAARLIGLAEESGVDPVRGVAIMELWDDLTIKDDTARLWQQTERIKAWLSMAELAQTEEQRGHALGKVADAADGLQRYFDYPVPGGAWENMNEDGTFRREDARASSLYHITCAIAEMHRTL